MPTASERVKRLQRALNHFTIHFRLPFAPLFIDGEPGHTTSQRVLDAKLALGYHPRYVTAKWDDNFLRILIHPLSRRLLKPVQIARGVTARRKLRKRPALRERAYQVAKGLIGVMEHGGNNVGPMVSKIIRAAGGTPGEPWCGDFVDFVYTRAGSKLAAQGWWGWYDTTRYTGVRVTRRPKRGDLVAFSFGHVGMYVRHVRAGVIETIEGNTGSSGAVSDSATGGDGVYRKQRSTSLVKHYMEVTR